MNHSIIGTAGHVDHGKTMLVKALTGTDTDRLAEEKRRGITIELGFAYLALPDGSKAGVIDVPGHEKFIRTMLAGAGSVDVALLVVAADEGFMPQTREHLAILSLLGIKRGVVALTKIDLTEPEWTEMVALDIEEELRGTFLEDAGVVPVSAATGEGIETLREAMFALLRDAEPKDPNVPFRLPVDRIFSVDGFGTVVTGTLIEGRLAEGDEIAVFPSGVRTRARNIQVHGQDVEEAFAGQRAAVNLAGLKRADIQKGDVLAAPGSMTTSRLLDVRLDALRAGREILHNSRLHLHHCAGETLCRVVLLDRERLAPGESGYAQLRLAEPLAAKPGDRFVVRFFSPVETVGGGLVLDPGPEKHRRNDAGALRRLETKEHGSLEARILLAFSERNFSVRSDVKRRLFAESPAFDAVAEDAIARGKLLPMSGDRIVHIDTARRYGERLHGILSAYHAEHPLHPGMRKDEAGAKLLPGTELPLADEFLELLRGLGYVKFENNLAAQPDFTVALSAGHRKMNDAIVQTLLQGGHAPPSTDEIFDALEAKYPKEKKVIRQSFDALVDEGTVVMLTPKIVMHREYCEKALALFNEEPVALGEFRDALGTSRKFAVALLEYFDKKGLTQKSGEARTLRR